MPAPRARSDRNDRTPGQVLDAIRAHGAAVEAALALLPVLLGQPGHGKSLAGPGGDVALAVSLAARAAAPPG